MAEELSSAWEAGCRYCGGEPQCTAPDLSAGQLGVQKMCALCSRCAQEFYRFMQMKVPGLGTPEINADQMRELPTIFAQVERHMKKWVSERDSQ